ncbi:MAG: helix-turn-helix transcriptional regulator [Phycisphaeraceae bacterium]
MAGHRPFSELRAKMSPQRRARNKEAARCEMERMLLAEIRELAGMTQADVAQKLNVSQSAVSQWEAEGDMRVSTLARIIHALGGQLEIIAHLPGGKIAVSPFSEKK